MFEQLTSPDLPNQRYTELVRTRDHERLARRLLRELKTTRRLARRTEPSVRPDELRPSTPTVEIYCHPRQA